MDGIPFPIANAKKAASAIKMMIYSVPVATIPFCKEFLFIDIFLDYTNWVICVNWCMVLLSDEL